MGRGIDNGFVIGQLFATGAFRFLEKPVILTSGEVGIYYINTEKLLRDEGKFAKYGDDPQMMVDHAVSRMSDDKDIRRIMEILAERVSELCPHARENLLISGGQRRDWLFSGPVAHILGIPHLALFKDGRALLTDDHCFHDADPDLSSAYIIHMSDLLTKASSAYDPRTDPPTGWIPVIRARHGTINDLFSVVDRKQGGDEALAEIGVRVHSLIDVGDNFFGCALVEGNLIADQHKIAVAYKKDPFAWSCAYIAENGVEAFVDAFDPVNKKDGRFIRFLKMYELPLRETGRFTELETAVCGRYGISISNMLDE